MSDDQDGCEWVNVSSGTGLPGQSRTKVKRLCVWGVCVVICLLQGANGVHVVKLMPLPPHLASLESRLVGMFGVSLPRLSLAKKALNKCYCVYCWRVQRQEMHQKVVLCQKTRKRSVDLGFRHFPRRKRSNTLSCSGRHWLTNPLVASTVCQYCTVPCYPLELFLAFCHICRLFLYFQLIWTRN